MEGDWKEHVRRFRQQNKDVKPKDVMRAASRTYRGGAVVPHETQNLASSASKVGGRRSKRRLSRKRRTRRR